MDPEDFRGAERDVFGISSALICMRSEHFTFNQLFNRVKIEGNITTDSYVLLTILAIDAESSASWYHPF